MQRKKLLLVFNPSAGKGTFPPLLYGVVERFTKAGYEVTAYPTQGPRDGYELIASRAGDFDFLCCAGGDGSLDEAVDALMTLEKRPTFGYIPSGTTNDFATSLKIPKDVLSAADTAVNGTPFPIDIGAFGGQFFAYVAAFGLFTEVTYDTPQEQKNLLGHAAYILEGVKRLRAIEYYECRIIVDDETLTGSFIYGMVSNSVSVGGFKVLGDDFVRLDDGLFEVVLVKRPRSFVDLQNIIASLLNREVYTESLIVRKAAKVRVISKKPLDWTLDGEFGGTTADILLKNIPRALEIMVPKPEIKIVEGLPE